LEHGDKVQIHRMSGDAYQMHQWQQTPRHNATTRLTQTLTTTTISTLQLLKTTPTPHLRPSLVGFAAG
jgi:hypothetical protein